LSLDGHDVDKLLGDGTVVHFIDYNSGTDDPVYAICDDGTTAYWVTNDIDAGTNKGHVYKKALTLTSTNNLLVGTTTDSGYKLDVNGTGRFVNGVNMATTSGKVLIGTATAPSAIGVNDLLVIGKSGSASNAINFSNGSTTNWGYLLAESGKMVLGSGTSSNITFETNAGIERMRLTSGGFFKASTNGTYVSSGGYHELRTNQNARALLITNSSTTLSQENGLDIIFTAASPNNATSKFIVCEDTSAFRFIVYSNGNVANTNNSYGSISDIKLKENIIDASPKLNDLLKVKVRNYNLIGEEAKQIGVIAQELEEIFPAMVDESIDKDKDGNDLGTTTKSVKYSVFVPMLIKAIQELKSENDNLKSRLEVLEQA